MAVDWAVGEPCLQQEVQQQRCNLLALVGACSVPFRIKQDHIGAVGLMKVLAALLPHHASMLVRPHQSLHVPGAASSADAPAAGELHHSLQHLQHLWKGAAAAAASGAGAALAECSAAMHLFLRRYSRGLIDASACMSFLLKYCLAYVSFYQAYPQ